MSIIEAVWKPEEVEPKEEVVVVDVESAETETKDDDEQVVKA